MSFKAQSSYSDAPVAPLNLCKKCTPDHYFQDVHTFQSELLFLKGFVVIEQCEDSKISKHLYPTALLFAQEAYF